MCVFNAHGVARKRDGAQQQRNSSTPCAADPVAKNESAFTFMEFHSMPFVLHTCCRKFVPANFREARESCTTTSHYSTLLSTRKILEFKRIIRMNDTIERTIVIIDDNGNRQQTFGKFKINGQPIVIHRESSCFFISRLLRSLKRRESLRLISNEKTRKIP